MAVKIKLARFGKIREPYYRVVVADARTRRGGRTIELVGKYHPKAEPSVIDIDSDRVQYWLGVGAQPTDPVVALLKVTGDWQKFKGLPGAEGTLKPQPEKVDKRARYEAAMAAVGGDDAPAATTARKRAPKKAEAAEPAATEAAEPVATEAAEPAGAAAALVAEAPVADVPADVQPVAATVPDASDVDAPAADTPFGAGSHAALADDAQPEGFPIKGNASSKLYHVPGSSFYDRTIAEVWFASAEAAEQAGFALPKSQQADDEPAGDTA